MFKAEGPLAEAGISVLITKHRKVDVFELLKSVCLIDVLSQHFEIQKMDWD